MNPVILSTYPPMAYSLPLGIWLFSQIAILGGDGLPYENSINSATQVLLLLQLLFALLYAPRLGLALEWKAALAVTGINILVPLPIYLLTWLMGHNTLAGIILSQSFVIFVGVLLIAITSGLSSIIKTRNVLDILLSTTQIALGILVWLHRDFVYSWTA
jgi:hypothetical protein